MCYAQREGAFCVLAGAMGACKDEIDLALVVASCSVPERRAMRHRWAPSSHHCTSLTGSVSASCILPAALSVGQSLCPSVALQFSRRIISSELRILHLRKVIASRRFAESLSWIPGGPAHAVRDAEMGPGPHHCPNHLHSARRIRCLGASAARDPRALPWRRLRGPHRQARRWAAPRGHLPARDAAF